MTKRATTFLLFLSISLYSQELSLDFFKDKPRSLAKDFYISQYLKQDIKQQDARELLGEVNNLNWALFYKFADKLQDFSFSRVKYCKKLKPSLYLGKSNDCIAMGLSEYKSTKLDSKTLLKISKLVKTNYPKLAKRYEIIASNSFDTLIKNDAKTIIKTFTSVGGAYRREHFNHQFPAPILSKLLKEKSFSLMVKKIVRDRKLNNLHNTLLKVDSSKISAEANFLLGLNALLLNKEDISIWYFKLSEDKAYTAFDKSKAIFWQYLLTKDPILLDKLVNTKDINLYSLYAYETLGLEPEGIITTLNPTKDTPPFDITDPFAWIKLKKMFKAKKYSSYEEKKNLALKFNSKLTEPHVCSLMYSFNQNKHYFLMPYFQYLKDYDKQRVALILALARQESKFIPTSVSYSYALGMMQFMPYVAKGIAKQSKFKNFQYSDMFKPEVAYKFANIHLNYLEKSLYHPLFIAYAYNGGLGFVKRKILQKDYFKDGKYEPFLSMEMMPNQQARHYGKKVLANYTIYSKLLGVDAPIKTLLKTLNPSNRTHRF